MSDTPTSNDLRGAYLLWGGKLVRVISDTPDARFVGLEYIEDSRCPNCDHNLGKEQFDVIPTSPLWAEKVRAVPTLPNNKQSGEEV